MGFVQVEIRRKRVDASRIRKKNRGYKNFPDTCGTGPQIQIIFKSRLRGTEGDLTNHWVACVAGATGESV